MILTQLEGASDYRWNEAARRYIAPGGKFVSNQVVKQSFETIVDYSKQNILTLSESLRAGTITLPDWQVAMMKEIRVMNSASGALGAGGWGQMTASDWGYVGSLTKEQYQFLNGFAADIQNGLPLDGNFIQRAGLYGEAQRTVYEDMVRRKHTAQGFDEERRVLGSADHCQTRGGVEGCLELAGKGWQPINTLPKIGAAPCIVRCHCTFEYRRSKKKGKK